MEPEEEFIPPPMPWSFPPSGVDPEDEGVGDIEDPDSPISIYYTFVNLMGQIGTAQNGFYIHSVQAMGFAGYFTLPKPEKDRLRREYIRSRFEFSNWNATELTQLGLSLRKPTYGGGNCNFRYLRTEAFEPFVAPTGPQYEWPNPPFERPYPRIDKFKDVFEASVGLFLLNEKWNPWQGVIISLKQRFKTRIRRGNNFNGIVSPVTETSFEFDRIQKYTFSGENNPIKIGQPDIGNKPPAGWPTPDGKPPPRPDYYKETIEVKGPEWVGYSITENPSKPNIQWEERITGPTTNTKIFIMDETDPDEKNWKEIEWTPSLWFIDKADK